MEERSISCIRNSLIPFIFGRRKYSSLAPPRTAVFALWHMRGHMTVVECKLGSTEGVVGVFKTASQGGIVSQSW